MKKASSIFLSLLMVIAVIHVSIAIHYCEGKEVATMVSFSGKLASCGMTYSKEVAPIQGAIFTRDCCNDTVTFCGISSIFSPSYSFVPESYEHNFHIFAIPVVLSAKSQTYSPSIYSNISPPGALMSTNVDLSDICVFRI